MNRKMYGIELAEVTVPRVRGDEPKVLLRLLILWLCLFLTRMLATGALSLLS